MAEQSPLRRWKRFFPAFGAIDAAIEAGAGGPARGWSRDRHRQLRGDLVERLCDAAGDDDDDDAEAEGICLLLDEAMAEALETLRLVPVTPAMLTATDVAGAVARLRRHESGRVRDLARAVFGGWRASVEGDLARVREALGKLAQVPKGGGEQPENTVPTAPSTGDVRGDRESMVLPPGKKQAEPQPAKKTPAPVAAGGAGVDQVRNERKRNREAEDAKRQRKVPEEQRPRKTQPIIC